MALTLNKIRQLEEAFKHDASPEEAAAIANITLQDLYDHIAANTDNGWYAKCLLSAHEPIAQAKINLGEAVLKHDLEASRYLLERKRPKDWSPRAQLDINDTRPMVVLPSYLEERKVIDVIPTESSNKQIPHASP